MELQKVKILLEDYISREPNSSYGSLTATSFSLNVFLTQELKDVGMFLDSPTIPYDVNYPPLSYAPIPQKLMDFGGGNFNFITQPGSNFYPTGTNNNDIRYKYKSQFDYFTNNIIVSGLTEDRLENVGSYGYTGNTKYIPGFDISSGLYYNYVNNLINGITRVISINDYNPIIYTEDGDINDPNLGTQLQAEGILFKTYTGQTRVLYNPVTTVERIPLTKMYYHGQGVNETNSTLSALTIEEYLLHITQKPKVDSDLFIDRGETSVLQSHLQMSEITTLEQLVNYNNGYYNMI
jgi:hypothetical protein